MSKKLLRACLALFALAAFILPTTASASPVVTHPTGTRLDPTGKTCTTGLPGICISGHNVGEILFKTDPASGEPSVLTRCTSMTITGGLTKNTGTEIEVTIHTATFEGTGGQITVGGMHECTGGPTFSSFTFTSNGGGVDGESISNGTPWCLRATNTMTADEFQLRGGACSEAARKITFILDATKLFGSGFNECKYERAAAEPVKGTFTTHSTGDAILSLISRAGTTSDTTFKGEAGNNVECPTTLTLEMSFTLETDNANHEPLYIS